MIVVVSNHKGGAGKTTTALNIADTLALRDLDVVAIDATVQGSLAGFLEDVPVKMVSDGVGGYARDLASRHAWVIIDTPAPSFDHDGLTYDKPTRAMLEAIAVADLVIVPTAATALDMATTIDALDTIREHKRDDARAVVLLNNVDTRTRDASTARDSLTSIGAQVLQTHLNRLVTYGRSPLASCGVQRFEPSSRAAKQVSALVDEVIGLAWST